VASIETHSGRCHSVPRTVNRFRVRDNELGGADSDPRVFAHRLDQIFQPLLVRASIVIDERDEVSVSRLESCRIAAGKTGVFPELNDFDIGKFFPDVAYGRIRRTVIDEDDLPIGIGLPGERTQAVLQKPLPVPVNDNNADLFLALH